MKTFHFQLESILLLRRRDEELAGRCLAQALAEENKVLTALNSLYREKNQLLGQWQTQRRHPARAFEETARFALVREMDTRILRLQEDFRAARQRRDEQAQVLLESRRKREILDRVKEKRWKEHCREAERAEEKAIEDLVHARFQGVMA